jgi:hypothetical protein
LIGAVAFTMTCKTHCTVANLGNAGDARYWRVVTDLAMPLDPIVANGLIEIGYKYRRSSFDDPIIGSKRRIASYAQD